jgi:hypothetical protein
MLFEAISLPIQLETVSKMTEEIHKLFLSSPQLLLTYWGIISNIDYHLKVNIQTSVIIIIGAYVYTFFGDIKGS